MEKETIKHILNVLRYGTITWHVRTQCLNRNRVQKQIGVTLKGKPKLKYFYYCDKCKKEFKDSSSLEVDHITEIGSFNGDFNTYIKRMYCPIDNLQSLCVSCHLVKTSNFNSSIKYTRKI
jgi:5-methylcytosine-specific restriction endonuclease McrA